MLLVDYIYIYIYIYIYFFFFFFNLQPCSLTKKKNPGLNRPFLLDITYSVVGNSLTPP